jgi:hypothetical protein
MNKEQLYQDLCEPLMLTYPDKINKYTNLIHTIEQSNMEQSEIEVIIQILKMTLNSKQNNEPYEELLSDVLGLINNDQKHGFDAMSQDGKEEYEYKPTKNKSGGTINDDSFSKIEKCEVLCQQEKKGWLILGFINTTSYSFDAIYKFPLEIYSDARREYLTRLMEKNKSKGTQTRSTYSINLSKSFELCRKYNKTFYVWKS